MNDLPIDFYTYNYETEEAFQYAYNGYTTYNYRMYLDTEWDLVWRPLIIDKTTTSTELIRFLEENHKEYIVSKEELKVLLIK
jgi:hypothetical protein